MKVKLIASIHSDKEIRYPEGYFNATVRELHRFWTMLEVDDRRMVMESVTRELDMNSTVNELFAGVIPEIYESAVVEVVPVN